MPSSTTMRHAPAGAVRVAPGRAAPQAPLAAPSSLLWSAQTLSRWAALVAVSALGVLTGWYVVAGESVWNDQRTGVSLGTASVIVYAFVSINLLLAGRRRIGLRRVQLLGELVPVPRGMAASAPLVLTGVPASDVLVGSVGLTRFHRADCPLAAGKDYPAPR